MQTSFDNHIRSIRNAAEIERRGIVAARKLFVESQARQSALQGHSANYIVEDDVPQTRKGRRTPLYHDTIMATTKLGAMFDLQNRPSNNLGKKPIVRKKDFGGRRIAIVIDPDTGIEHTLHATRGWKVTGRYPVVTTLELVE
jgi:hypothetical protein